MNNLDVPVSPTACEVCGQLPPPGHRICDACWPDRALEVGRAGRCVVCERPRLIKKLTRRDDGKLVCLEHLTRPD